MCDLFCYFGRDAIPIRFCPRSGGRFAYRLRYLRNVVKHTLSFRPKKRKWPLWLFSLFCSVSSLRCLRSANRILFATRDFISSSVPLFIYERSLLRVTQYTLRVCISTKKRENSPCGCFLFFAWYVNSVLFCRAKAGSHTVGITKRSEVTLSFRPFLALYAQKKQSFSQDFDCFFVYFVYRMLCSKSDFLH